MSAKSWVLTWNNYREEDYETLKGLVPAHANFIILGREGKEIGKTPHIQGFVTFSANKRRAGIIKLTGTGGHWAVSRASDKAKAIDYCKKEGEYEEFGQPPGSGQGQRTDLEIAAREFQEHRSLPRFKEDNPHLYVKYARGFSTLLEPKPRDLDDPPPNIIWLYGPTGTGKTRYVYAQQPRHDLWVSSNSLEWFNGYNNHPTSLFDDFRGSFCSFGTMLLIVDRYGYNAPIKGGFVDFKPQTMYITSPYHPKDVYKTVEDKSQLLRRFTRIYKCLMDVPKQLVDVDGEHIEEEPEGLPDLSPPDDFLGTPTIIL